MSEKDFGFRRRRTSEIFAVLPQLELEADESGVDGAAKRIYAAACVELERRGRTFRRIKNGSL